MDAVEPKFVVSVLADAIRHRPVRTAAQDEQGQGLAVRFPQVVGFVRHDKSPEDVTTTTEVAGMFDQQRRSSTKPK